MFLTFFLAALHTAHERNVPVFKLLRGWLEVYRPCYGQLVALMVHSSVPNFTPIGSHRCKNWKFYKRFTIFSNINAPHGCRPIPCTIFINICSVCSRWWTWPSGVSSRRRLSPVDHIQRPALCIAWWAIRRDASRHAVPLASAETCLAVTGAVYCTDVWTSMWHSIDQRSQAACGKFPVRSCPRT